ncbi:MAG: hypothetical protein FWD01_03155, partial [Defluviitaleaceae bacterium]|nr:hypothetical protein [Defluviitaleaceae bacterium]
NNLSYKDQMLAAAIKGIAPKELSISGSGSERNLASVVPLEILTKGLKKLAANEIGNGKSLAGIKAKSETGYSPAMAIAPVVSTESRKVQPRNPDTDGYSMAKYNETNDNTAGSLKQRVASIVNHFEVKIDKLVLGGATDSSDTSPGKLATFKEELKEMFRDIFGELWEEAWYDLSLKHPSITQA